MSDLKLNQIPDASLPLQGDEYLLVDQAGLSRKIQIDDLPSGGVEDAPIKKLSTRLEIGVMTLPANSSVEVSMDLGDVYKEVLLTSFEWIISEVQQDIPNARLGLESFSGKSSYNFCLKVKQGAGNSVRLFNNLKKERSGVNADLLESEVFDTVSDVGVALGYGTSSNQNLIDNFVVNQKKIEISDVYLDGSLLKVVITNHESSDIELSPYTGLFAVEVRSIEQGASPVFYSVFGDSSIHGCKTHEGSNNIRHHFSHDKGETWTSFNSITSNSVIGTVAKGTSSNFFMAFLNYNFNLEVFEGSDDTITSQELVTLPLEPARSNINASDPARYHSEYAGIFDYPQVGRNMDAVDKNLIVFSCFGNKKIRLELVENLTTHSTIFRSEDHYTVTDSPTHVASTVKVADANTYFLSFGCYGDTNLDPSPVFFPANRRQCLVKTEDGGQTWSKLLEDHIEFCRAHTHIVHISDDGMTISVVAFYVSPTNSRKALFNLSEDGGQTWKFLTGSWSEIISPDSSNKISSEYFNMQNWRGGLLTGSGLYRNMDIEDTILIIFDSNMSPHIFRTNDDGLTWSTGTAISSFSRYPALNYSMVPAKAFDANDSFIAFGAYAYLAPNSDIDTLFTGGLAEKFTDNVMWGLK